MRACKLTNSAAIELARLHGSHENAKRYRCRSHMAKKKDGASVAERILVVNDLHMAAGLNVETQKIHPCEEFTAQHERQFFNYMKREWALAESTDHKITLCLNGDVLDILQTATERPGFTFPDGYTRNGRAPENTPANVIVQLNIIRQGHPLFFQTLAAHLLKGHKIDFLPGNHDRQMYNRHVWQGSIEHDGKNLKGFLGILEDDLRTLCDQEDRISESLGGVSLKPFGIYGDAFVDHGDMADKFNKVQRPYKELLYPSELHETMPMAFGDYCVRNGFNRLESLQPKLSGAGYKSELFWHLSFRHPKAAIKLIACAFPAACKEGYEISREVDYQERVDDIRALVDRFPEITNSLNAMRPENERLSVDQIKDGLSSMETASATPLFSNFRAGTGFFKRLYRLVRKRIDGRIEGDIQRDRMSAANQGLGLNNFFNGHTHKAKNDIYITDEEKMIRHIDTHTWMDRQGKWGRGELTWGPKGRGVGVIELGENRDGELFTDISLNKVRNEEGDLVEGDIYAEADQNTYETAMKMRRIYANSHPRNRPTRNIVGATPGECLNEVLETI